MRGEIRQRARGMRIAAIVCHELGIGAIGPNYRIAGDNRATAPARAGSVRRRDRIPFLTVDGQSPIRPGRCPAGSGCRCARGPLSNPSDCFASPGARFHRYNQAASKSTLNCLFSCSGSRGTLARTASGSPNWKIFRRKSLRVFPRLTYSPLKSSCRLAAIIKVEALESLREKYVDENRQFIVFSNQYSSYRLYRQKKTRTSLWAHHILGGRVMRPRAAACPNPPPSHAPSQIDSLDGAKLSRKKISA
jgi:hypothetical protein